MTRLSKLCARFLGDRGFSIGVDDVTPSLGMRTIKTRIVADGQRLAQEQITAYKSGKIRLKPGCDALQVPVVIACPANTQLQSVPILAPLLARVQPPIVVLFNSLTQCFNSLCWQSLESEVNGLLGKVRENCGKEALGALSRRNAPLCMAQCGSKVTSCGGLTYLLMLRCGPCVMCEASKPSRPLTLRCLCACGGARWQGSPLNISQMIACLGQQSVGGQRIQDGFVGRTLPHFPVGALYPAAKGTAECPVDASFTVERQVLVCVPFQTLTAHTPTTASTPQHIINNKQQGSSPTRFSAG